jgi:hypothetical protein
MKRTNLSVIVYVCLVFLSGVVVGVVGAGMYHGAKTAPSGSEAARQRYREDMRTRLQLSPDQLKKLDVIIGQTHERFRALREKYKPEVIALQAEHADKVRAILDDRQRAEYEKMRQERQKQESEKHSGAPGH